MILKVQRTLRILVRVALDRVGVDHRCPYIAVPQEFLDRANIVVRLQKMASIAVPQGMGRCALGDRRLLYRLLDRFLHKGIVQMITAILRGTRYMGQRHRWEKPLPCPVPVPHSGISLSNASGQKYARVARQRGRSDEPLRHI